MSSEVNTRYRPYPIVTDVRGPIEHPGIEMVMPSDNVDVKVGQVAFIEIKKGVRFAMREGGRTSGAGISEINK